MTGKLLLTEDDIGQSIQLSGFLDSVGANQLILNQRNFTELILTKHDSVVT